MSWSHFTHGADLGLRGYGRTKAEAFQAIATALTAAVTDPSSVTAKDTIRMRCRSPNDEVLLVDWLNALIYEMDVRKFLFCDFSVTIVDGTLNAMAAGEPVNREKHRPAVEVKGATYTALAVHETEDGWLVQCVVDV